MQKDQLTQKAIFQIVCKDRSGIVAKIAQSIADVDGNIVTADQYSSESDGGVFFLRMEVSSQGSLEPIEKAIKSAGSDLDADVYLYKSLERPKIGFLVSKEDHCLKECLYRCKSGELNIDIDCVIGNHDIHKELCDFYNVQFHYIPAKTGDRKEDEVLEYVKDKTDGLILARYMQILSKDFIKDYRHPIINIHHSFLPSFKGANPYRQALDRGVKIIGATTHFVTEGLDEGPIIQQAVRSISHKDTIESIKAKSKVLEKNTLAETIALFSQRRIIRHENKTVIF